MEVLNKSGLFGTDANVTVIVSPYVCLRWEMRTAPWELSNRECGAPVMLGGFFLFLGEKWCNQGKFSSSRLLSDVTSYRVFKYTCVLIKLITINVV